MREKKHARTRHNTPKQVKIRLPTRATVPSRWGVYIYSSWFYGGSSICNIYTHSIAQLSLGTIFTAVQSNEDLLRCVKIGVYMGFWVYRGSSLLWLPVIRLSKTAGSS